MTPFRFQGLLEKKPIHVPLVTEMDAPLGVCLARLRHLISNVLLLRLRLLLMFPFPEGTFL